MADRPEQRPRRGPFRPPQALAYSRANIYQRGENAVSQTIPEIELAVDNILG